jgi:multidrug efflux pump
VLIPLLFMQDVVGRLFREFAVTLAVTILISAVVSLTLVPMMCAKLLQAPRPADGPAWSGQAGRVVRRRSSTGTAALTWVLDHQRLTLYVAIGTLGRDRNALHPDPEGLLPEPGHGPDPGRLGGQRVDLLCGHGRTAAGAAAAILKDPDVASLSSFIGVDGNNVTLNSGGS